MRVHSVCSVVAIPLFLTLTGAQCSNTAIIDVAIGPFTYSLDAQQVTIPDQFVDSSTQTIRTIACSDDSTCPMLGAGQPAVHCTAMTCTPDPFPFELASATLDLNSNATVQRYGDNVTVLELREVHYTASGAGLTNAIGPTFLYWGPASATTIASPGVQMLGTIPVIQLASGASSGDQLVMLDATGAAALSDYLLHTSRQFRLLTQPRITVVPGGPVPSGNVSLDVQMLVHIEGQLVR